MTREKVKVGLLGVGLDTYWKQFDGLLARLLSYQDSISSQIGAMDAEVINVGMVDTPEKARQSAMFLKQADVEVRIFVYFYLCSVFHNIAGSTGSWQTYCDAECAADFGY